MKSEKSKKDPFRIIIGKVLILYLVIIAIYQFGNPQTRWNWDKIDLNELSFPDDFTWGVAAAAHQVEGNNTNNQWYLWESAMDTAGNPRIIDGQKAGLACDHWNRYPEDIQLMKDLGVSSYRFSLEWSRIETEKGVFNEDAVSHYLQMCDSMLAEGIEPMITLHHFSNPIWFEQKGAFEKEENIQDFIEFVEYVFPLFSSRVEKWCTINEPGVYVSDGYFIGVNPPGKSDPEMAGRVLRNLLEAHVQAYYKIKSLPGGDKVMVGLVKNMTLIDPHNKWNLADWVFSSIVNNLFNEASLNFLETGKFKFVMPTMVKIKEENPDAIGTCDFIGLNYYSHYNLKFRFNLDEAFENIPRQHELPTDMEYSQYPEGFYRSAKRLSKLGVPIIVTENGIADESDEHRDLYIRRYLYALSKAIDKGVDVQGYYYWSLMDNFEWSSGYNKKFGLYQTDFDSQKRTLRQGSEAYREIINK